MMSEAIAPPVCNTMVNTNGLSSYISNTIPVKASFFLAVGDESVVGVVESEITLVLEDVLVVVKGVLIEEVESMVNVNGLSSYICSTIFMYL